MRKLASIYLAHRPFPLQKVERLPNSVAPNAQGGVGTFVDFLRC
jgi:hypothetical protein